MKITVLSENTSSSQILGSEHGLSLYIETEKHKLLFDTGASGLFAENATKLGIDLAKVDLAVLSHGHYDHGGGLKSFLNMNDTAKIYVHQKAFEPHYAIRGVGTEPYDIGLDETLTSNERFLFCGDRHRIDEELELFSGVVAQRLVPSCNGDLLMKQGDAFVLDDLTHEQNLIIRENGKTLLIAGCAHNGIINIIDHFVELEGCPPDYVLGGFHLYSHGTKQVEAPSIVDEIGTILLDTRANYYTCHCTGLESYQRLKAVMGDSIGYLSTGDRLKINP
jgi:7,8-dihydropterin-6-yl-methyl-4-(beta-D-ribofuranosyl)aminobenzene 5'-phosphate synthase